MHWFQSHHCCIFCSWVLHFLSNRQHWHKRSKAGRRGIKCQQKIGLSLCQLFPQESNIVHFLIIHSKVQTASHPGFIQMSTKNMFLQQTFVRNRKYAMINSHKIVFRCVFLVNSWLFKIATQSNFHLRLSTILQCQVLNVKHWIWQNKFHSNINCD